MAGDPGRDKDSEFVGWHKSQQEGGGNDDLAQMYVKTGREKERKIEMRAAMDAPPQSTFSAAMFLGLVLAAILVVGVALLFIIPRTMIDENGDEFRVSTMNYLLQPWTQSERVRNLTAMTPDYRAVYLSRERLIEVAKAVQSLKDGGEEVESVKILVRRNLVSERSSRDLWGNEFRIKTAPLVRVTSAGEDGDPGNADDLIYENGAVRVPSKYATMEMEKSGSL